MGGSPAGALAAGGVGVRGAAGGRYGIWGLSFDGGNF